MCQDCREQNLWRKREQFDAAHREERHPPKKGGYESKSKKVWRDRFEAARKDLKRGIQWYVEARERGWLDNWLYKRLERHEWLATRYRRARADAKAHGAI